MINISKLTGYNKQDIRNVVLLLQEFVKTYKDNKIKLNYQSRPVILFLSTLIATAGIGVFFTFRSIVTKYNEYVLSKRLRRPSLIRQSSNILKNGSREIFIQKGNGKVTRIIIPKANNDQYAADKYLYKDFARNEQILQQQKGRLFNSRFLNQLTIIWKILIPKFYCQNTSLLLSQCFFLIFRTWLSLLIAKLDGQIVKNLIAADGRKFARDLIYFLLIAFPASYTNAAIKYLELRLALGFRTNLTRYIHDMYLDKTMSYYKVGLSGADIQNIDQYITEDVTKFCLSLCSLFSSMGKPFIDLIFFSVYLRDNLGTGAIIGIFANYFATAIMLKKATPRFGKLASKRTHLEGVYFNQQLNIMTNSEEIGFYKGSKIEKSKLAENFQKLMDHMSQEINLSSSYAALEDYVLKYTWLAWGYIFSGLPVFLDVLFPKEDPASGHIADIHDDEHGHANTEDTNSTTENMKTFVTNKRLLLSLADAGSRLMVSLKEVTTLTGITNRVFNMLTQLHRVHDPKFDYGDKYGLTDIHGTYQLNYDGLRLEHVPITVPTSEGSYAEPLIPDLTFDIKGKNLLFVGPNGSGKTSVARVLAGLWPLYAGLVLKPLDLFFNPQKSYFTSGSLRDQVVYPNRSENATNDQIFHILHCVNLDHIVKRYGLNQNLDFAKTLSGGEKQRLSFARILFNKPSIVILDDSTSALSPDMEELMYQVLQDHKINYVTLSNRPSLSKFHDKVFEI
ncbi:MAG: ATP-binding cassette domain-containing protein [Asgard group archaeon]|nr:ATP-binding cassette domain-containing protein [Asgard group archaeon]